MKEGGGETHGGAVDTTAVAAVVGQPQPKPALQVICLGASGGPCEDNVTSFLVRSTGNEWSKGSIVAVDAGSHLGPITRILEDHFPRVWREKSKGDGAENGVHGDGSEDEEEEDESSDEEDIRHREPTIVPAGPFAGLKLPHECAGANALHLLRTYISTYLITHPHLDHMSAFAINTAAFHATSKPKTVAALPHTVEAMKQHIFNDVIWPNLTDEDGGVGFVTFQRLKEGGDVMLGEGEGRGYIDVCDGLGVRSFKVSHGTCTKSPPSHVHRGSIVSMDQQLPPSYNGGPIFQEPPTSAGLGRSFSISHAFQGSLTPRMQAVHAPVPPIHSPPEHHKCVVDSTAYFIRDVDSQREVLMFGDVEPDSISLSPRNHVVWQEAAHKIACGLLGGIFIESSYDDSQADAYLFGHLNPRHLIAELQNLAQLVGEARAARLLEKSAKKRKRDNTVNGYDSAARRFSFIEPDRKRSRSLAAELMAERRRASNGGTERATPEGAASPTAPAEDYSLASPRTSAFPLSGPVNAQAPLPLKGLRVVIIHVKDTFRDGPPVGRRILSQLRAHERRLQADGHGLGCEFVVAKSGESYWF